MSDTRQFVRPGTGSNATYPPVEQWDDWVEYDSKSWPRRVEKRYMLVPTLCFNCEAACGLMAYVDKETLEVRKFEGNPVHPGSRGRNCAKGPATLNQITAPDRILHPMQRAGARGEGRWERVSWDAALDDIAARIRRALQEKRHNEVMYHVGRPGEDGYMPRILQAWGIDGHNSHTNVCSAAARTGYAFWMGDDRPSPDYANAKCILLISAHLETGHYFNPHAQRIMEGKQRGAKLIVFDVRLSNTASVADYWVTPWPGSEAAILLAIAKILLDTGRIDREFVSTWVNWQDYLRALRPGVPVTFDAFVDALRDEYATFTPEFAEAESLVPAETIRQLAEEVARAGSSLSTHIWRSAAAGNEGGWQIARATFLLNVLTGSVGSVGGVSPNVFHKITPAPFAKPPAQNVWNELTWPEDYPLAHHEMSFAMPHLMRERGHKLDVYFTRVYNPVWTNPDGFTWIEMLRDEAMVACHVALTPTWSETAWWADYVLPMGHGSERHDNQSQETHAGTWVGFRQPVLRVARERLGLPVEDTRTANPGEVWEEGEFWIELSWRIDPDGSLGIRKFFESPYRPGEKVSIEEYYRWMFENSVPGLPERAAEEGLNPLAYMKKYGVFEVRRNVYEAMQHERPLPESDSAQVDDANIVRDASGRAIGVAAGGRRLVGFPTPTRKLEIYSATLAEWGWPEHATPGYVRSHVHHSVLARDRGEFALVPTFRLPVMIHTRSNNAKWLVEIAHTNPLWLNPIDAERLGLATGDLAKVSTDIGHFVLKTWVTEGIRPGVVACSHHMGRWRRDNVSEQTPGTDKWASVLVKIDEGADGTRRVRKLSRVGPFASTDPDSGRVWWGESGVHQNLTFPIHPDPVSGQHCWHQRVRVERAGDLPEGEVFVDLKRAQAVATEWLAKARPATGELRRPLWLHRPYKPTAAAYRRDKNAAG
ncbi:MAG TPA: molybdopterin-dependent oxidoreductase [Blastocatellia bacterium]|nr:molybdopterin-dependent oxidoreductase [Blastocatellia bacterium]